MKKGFFRFVLLGVALCVLCRAGAAFATSSLVLSSSGGGGFFLQGEGMENVAALDITITYDVATLSNPRIMQGALISGAMSEVNANVPGTIRMAVITLSPLHGAGNIATLLFDHRGAEAGKIIALRAALADLKGNSLPVTARIINPPDSPVNASGSPENQPPADRPAPSGVPAAAPQVPGQQTLVGGIAAPLNEQAVEAKKGPAASETAPEPAGEQVITSREPRPDQPSKSEPTPEPQDRNKSALYTSKSVLARFREYTGPRTPKTLVLLFEQEPLIGFRQDPPLFLSDGRNTVSVTFIAMSGGKSKPDVAVKGAALVSLEKDPDNTNTWIAKVKPNKGAYESTLVVPQGRVTMEFPLTIAPKANIDFENKGRVTEADFSAFLKEQGAQKKPKFDLNGDGKHDSVDDYVYTANFIAAQKASPAPATKKQGGQIKPSHPAQPASVN